MRTLRIVIVLILTLICVTGLGVCISFADESSALLVEKDFTVSVYSQNLNPKIAVVTSKLDTEIIVLDINYSIQYNFKKGTTYFCEPGTSNCCIGKEKNMDQLMLLIL